MNALEKLLKLTPLPKCERCQGSGLITVYGNYWSPSMGWCGRCGGTGYLKNRAAPAHPGEEGDPA